MRRPGPVTIAATVAAVLTLTIGVASAEGYDRPGVVSQIDYVSDIGAPDGFSYYSSMSENGRYVAFDTDAPLSQQDTNRRSDVYVRDLKTDRVWHASAASDGTVGLPMPKLPSCPAEDHSMWYVNNSLGLVFPASWDPAISGDGRHVAFASWSSNLVPGDTNLAADVFLFDRKSGALERISVDPEGDQGASTDGTWLECPMSWSPSIDRHGRRVTFTSVASNIVADDSNGSLDVFVRDTRKDVTKRVSVRLGGDKECEVDIAYPPPIVGRLRAGCPPTGSIHSSISSDGRFIAFQSGDDDLVPGDTNELPDIFVRDLRKETTERVSLDSSGEQIGDNLRIPSANSTVTLWYTSLGRQRGIPVQSISADGRFVVFSSDANDVVPVGGGGLFVRDRKTGRTERINVRHTGELGVPQAPEPAPAISRDGRFVFYKTGSSNIGVRDGEGTAAAGGGYSGLVFDRMSGAYDIVSRATSGEFGRGCRKEDQYGSVWPGDMSFDGRYVSMSTCNLNMQQAPDSDPERYHVVMRDRGLVVGTGGLGGDPWDPPQPPDDRICIEDFCVPPGGWLTKSDAAGDPDLLIDGADLIEAKVVHRPGYQDLYIAAELEHMPTPLTSSATLGSSSPTLLYGVRFETGGRSLEVRATSQNGGTFELFDCSASSIMCTNIADLGGGVGTTGHRVVFSLPLAAVGLEEGGDVTEIQAFTALGSRVAGPLKVLDRVRIR